jgi:hypothetical protein
VPTFDVAALISNGLRKVTPSNPRSRANGGFWLKMVLAGSGPIVNAYNASLDATATALANRNAAVEALRTALTQLMAYAESLAVTEAEWKYAGSSTKSSGTLKGNTPGKIWLRVAAKGADDQPGACSDPAEDLVR